MPTDANGLHGARRYGLGDGDLLQQLAQRAAEGRPLRVGLIGAGKFGAMFLSQALGMEGLHVVGVSDLSPERARESLQRAGWPEDEYGARDFASAIRTGSTHLTDDTESLLHVEGLEVVVEATGDPQAGLSHALQAFEYGRHVVMVTVEADALAGPLVGRRAREAGLVYSMAYGDQPALICEMVEWARASGFEAVCAGKGTKYLPQFHGSTPDTVWDHYGYPQETVELGDRNPKMYNSFLDGTKSAIEMAAVANATGLRPQPAGLGFPPCGTDDLPSVCCPQSDGGTLAHKGTVEVVSSLHRDGRDVEQHLRWGVYVTFEGATPYAKRCLGEYGLPTDPTGQYSALWRPFHLVGLELSVSVLKAGLRGEATGTPHTFCADVVAKAKRGLAGGEVLDGEGGYRVYGALMPAADALRVGGLPIGLAHDVVLNRCVKEGEIAGWADVAVDAGDPVVQLRREMESSFGSA